MTVSFACPYCGKSYEKVKKELVGKKARCSCGKVIRVGMSSRDRRARERKPTGNAPRDADAETAVPTVDVEIKNRLVVDDHYNDLDQLLDADYAVPVPEPPAQPIRQTAAPIPPTLVPAAKARETGRRSNRRLAIGFLAAILSATIAFWFGFVIVSSRFVEFDQVLLKDFSERLASIHRADFGMDETSAGLKTGFAVTGWAMWGVALLMMILAIGQFLDAFVQLFSGRRIISWGDGLVASMGITFVFLIVAMIFLHNSHMTSLHRELNKIQAPEAFGESSLQNVERVRNEYKERSRNFITFMLTFAIIPMSVFVFSMIRLFALTGDTKRIAFNKTAARGP
jgi:hypothetical protein